VFYGKLPYPVVIGIELSSSFAVAIAAYYLVEEPSIRLGRYLISRRVQNRSEQIMFSSERVFEQGVLR
jgi:peptidoglycan/LPS O-acetylase OafA/YrhL